MSSLDSSTHSTYDVAVVGNGALGLSLGLVLARRGVKVAVIGEASRPYAASAAAGAMNGCFGEVTPNLLRSKYGRTKLAMDVRATGMWPEWEQLLAEESDVKSVRTANGTIVILNTIGIPEIDNAGYAAIRSALDEYKEPYEDLDPQDIEWLKPEPTSRPLKAMFIPGEHAVNAPALLGGLAVAITRSRGSVIDAHVRELTIDGDRVSGVVLTSGETVSAATVVLAAGASSHKLLQAIPAEIRDRIPAMVSGCGAALLVHTADGTVPDSVIRTPNRAFACGLHIVPRGDGLVYVGATNEISPVPHSTAAIGELNLLFGGMSQMRTDLVDGRVKEILAGNRPVPLDGYPLLGEAGIAGLWMMTGTYRDGLHQSPMLAHDFAARILGEPHDAELDIFTPVRKPIQALSREVCLETAVKHTLAVGYEHDWNIPDDWPPMIEEYLRQAYSKAIEDIDPEYTPPPELLFFVEPEIHDALRNYYRAWRS